MSPRIPSPKHRPKTIIPKQGLFLQISPEKMVLFKEMLFEHGLTGHQMIDYLIGLWDTRDASLMDILERSLEYRKKHMFEGKDRGKFVETDADILYRAIEIENIEKLKKEK